MKQLRAEEMNIATWILLIWWCLCIKACLVGGKRCREPDDLDGIKANLTTDIEHAYLSEMHVAFNNGHHNLSKAYDIFDQRHLDLNSTNLGRKIHYRRLFGHAKCTTARKSAGTVCPSYKVLEFDPDREPVVIAKARCTCKKCFHPDALSKCGANCMRIDGCRGCWMDNKCEEVYSYIPVIRRRCADGYYKYFIYIEQVAVGCTCRSRDFLSNTIP